MSELLRRVADLALVHPKVVCTEAIDEIVVEWNSVFQILDALPQFGLAAGEKYRVYQSEENFRHLVAIGTEERLNRYVHS